MTKDLKATKFHRKCDALRMSKEDREVLWRFVTETETDLDDPMIEFVVLVGLSKVWLETHSKLITVLPNYIDRILLDTAANLEGRIDARIRIAASQVAKQAASAQIRVVREAIADHANEQSNSWRVTGIVSWFFFGVVVCLLCYTFGYMSQFSLDRFWNELLTTPEAINWRRIIEANPKMPQAFANCGLDFTRAFSHDGSPACDISLWTTSRSHEPSWLDRLMSWPASFGMLVAPAYLVVSFLTGVAITILAKCVRSRVPTNG